ncbi:hypothetical protein ACF0H5_013294 [Mactra antiquata]
MSCVLHECIETSGSLIRKEFEQISTTMKSLVTLITIMIVTGQAIAQGPMFRGGNFQIRTGGIGPGSMGGTGSMFNRSPQFGSARFGGRTGGRTSFGPGSSRGQSGQGDPEFIRRILGSTVAGRELRMGEMDLPRHGGAGIGERHADGMLNGWNGNPQTLTTQFQDPWTDPFRGGPVQFPPGFGSPFRGGSPFWCKY